MLMKDYDVFLKWGMALYSLGKWDQAILRYEQAWALNTYNKEVCKQWGRALMKQEKYEEALAKYKLAIELDAGDPSLYFEWGKVLYEQEKYKEAISLYDKTLQMNDKDVHTYLDKEIALRHLGCDEEAEQMHSQLEELLERDFASRSMMIERIEVAINISSIGGKENLTDQKKHLKKKVALLREVRGRLKSISEEDKEPDEKRV